MAEDAWNTRDPAKVVLAIRRQPVGASHDPQGNVQLAAASAGANDGLIAPAGGQALDETFVLKLLKPCPCARVRDAPSLSERRLAQLHRVESAASPQLNEVAASIFQAESSPKFIKFNWTDVKPFASFLWESS
jgi:hypothetical protein